MADPTLSVSTASSRYGSFPKIHFQNPTAFLKTAREVAIAMDVIANVQEKAAICLYSRSTEKRYVEQVHKNFEQELVGLVSTIQVCSKQLKLQSEQLLCLKDKKAIAEQWQELSCQAAKLRLMKMKNADLLLLFRSPMHREAVYFYKEQTRQCIEKKNVATIATAYRATKEKMGVLSEEEKKESLKLICAEIKIVYVELFHFFLYILRGISENSDSLQKEIQADLQSVERVTKELSSLTICEPPIAGYSQLTFQIVPLRPERCFKGDIWFLQSRYPRTYACIIELQALAKELQLIEADLERSIFMSCRGTVQACTIHESLNLFEKQLKQQQDTLCLLDFASAPEVREVLPYAASLSAWIREIRKNHTFFLEIAKTNETVFSAQIKLLKYLNPLDPASDPASKDQYGVEAETIINLYNAIVAHQELTLCRTSKLFSEKWSNKTLKTCKSIIDYLGPDTLVLTENEEATLVYGIAKRSLSFPDLPVAPGDSKLILQSLITKRMVQALHFSDRLCDPELDLLLHILSFAGQLSKDPDFQGIYKTYSHQSPYEYNSRQLTYFSEIFALLYRKPSHNRKADLFIYCQCRQLFFDMSQECGNHSSYRLASLKAKAEMMLSKIRERYHFPDYFDTIENSAAACPDGQKAFKLFLQALWGKESAKKNDAIDKILQSKPAVLVNEYIQSLLEELSLQKLYNGEPLTDKEKGSLTYLFNQYIINSKESEQWGLIHDIGFMETTLYLMTCTNQYFQLQLRVYRTAGLYDRWKTAIGKYRQFTTLMTQNATFESINQLKEFIDTLETGINDPLVATDPTYFPIFEYLYKQMYKKFREITPKQEAKA